MAPEIDNVARVGGLPENACPEIGGGSRGLMPEGLQVPERSGNVRPTGSTALGGLMRGEHGLDHRANDVHEGSSKDPAQSDGQLEGPLPSGGVVTLLLGIQTLRSSLGPRTSTHDVLPSAATWKA